MSLLESTILLSLTKDERTVLNYIIDGANSPYAGDPLKDIYEVGKDDLPRDPYAALKSMADKVLSARPALPPDRTSGSAQALQAHEALCATVEPLLREMYPNTLDYGGAAQAIAGAVVEAIQSRPFDFLHGLGYRAPGASVTVNVPQPPPSLAPEGSTGDSTAPPTAPFRPEFAPSRPGEPYIAAVFSSLLCALELTLRPGRQRELVATKLEEAFFWACRALAVQEAVITHEPPKVTP